jgi:hypothetical protein
MIYQTLQEETKARPGRKVKIINLGLEPWEGIEMGLDPENLVQDENKQKKRKAVGDYIRAKDPEYDEWLQTHRIELNEMSTPQFLQWLDDKMKEYGQGKLIAPDDVMVNELHDKAREKLMQKWTDKILRENDLERQVNREYDRHKPTLDEIGKELAKIVTESLQKEPAQSWRDPVIKMAEDAIK